MYIRDLFASAARPVRDLKDFQQVELKVGESKTLSFKITEKSIGFYDNEGKWTVEQGDFEVFVGGNYKATFEAGFSFWRSRMGLSPRVSDVSIQQN